MATFIASLKEMRNCAAIVAIALFNFVFLGVEYLFDAICADFVGESAVVNSQNLMLGVSVLGFVLFAVLGRGTSKKTISVAELVLAIVALALMPCLLVLPANLGFWPLLVAGALLFILLGYAGAKSIYYVARRVTDFAHLAKLVGCGYALGVGIQFANNNLVGDRLVQVVVLMVGFALCVALAEYLHKLPELASLSVRHQASTGARGAARALVALVVSVALLAAIFSTLDNAVTLVHAAGSFNIGQWPRLILAVSGLLAGILFDLKNRRFMTFIMYTVAILSVACIVVIQLGGSFIIGLFVFYLSAGFFVVFFMTSFMELSFHTRTPKMWAGFGRAVNNLCAFATTALSVALLQAESQILILVLALVLFVGSSASLLIYERYRRGLSGLADASAEALKAREAGESEDDKLALFVQTYSLTEREAEVMKTLVHSSASIQEIAAALFISRAALYRHIASINAKTNTSNRKELLYFYHDQRL